MPMNSFEEQVVNELVQECEDDCIHMVFKRIQKMNDAVGVALRNKDAEYIDGIKVRAIVEVSQVIYMWTHLNMCTTNIPELEYVWNDANFRTKMLNSAIDLTCTFCKLLSHCTLDIFPNKLSIRKKILDT